MLILIALALILLLLLTQNGAAGALRLPGIDTSPFSNIPIPATGEIRIDAPDIDFPDIRIPDIRLPDIEFPAIRFPESWKIGADTDVTAQDGAPDWGVRVKTSGCQISGSLPDPQCTPGALATVSEKELCSANFSPVDADLPGEVERAVYTAYGVQNAASAGYQVNRLVPLRLGGSNDLANLWPIPAGAQPGFAEKQQVEEYLYGQVCSNQMTLAEAQQQVAVDWVAVYRRISD